MPSNVGVSSEPSKTKWAFALLNLEFVLKILPTKAFPVCLFGCPVIWTLGVLTRPANTEVESTPPPPPVLC